MLFNSYIFIFIFLPAALIGWYGLNRYGKYKLASLFLAGMSLWFYGYFNVSYLAIILCSIATNYALSYLLTRIPPDKRQSQESLPDGKKHLPLFNRLGLLSGIVLNLGILFYFKYYNIFFSINNQYNRIN
mgnify:FL=1